MNTPSHQTCLADPTHPAGLPPTGTMPMEHTWQCLLAFALLFGQHALMCMSSSSRTPSQDPVICRGTSPRYLSMCVLGLCGHQDCASCGSLLHTLTLAPWPVSRPCIYSHVWIDRCFRQCVYQRRDALPTCHKRSVFRSMLLAQAPLY